MPAKTRGRSMAPAARTTWPARMRHMRSRGPSGCGKSDLALRLIDAGARLVADDRTDLAISDGRVFASAPVELSGLIEVRGVGIVSMAALKKTPLALAVDLVGGGDVERMPEPASVDILGLSIPLLHLAPFEASAAAKVRAALKFNVKL